MIIFKISIVIKINDYSFNNGVVTRENDLLSPDQL